MVKVKSLQPSTSKTANSTQFQCAGMDVVSDNDSDDDQRYKRDRTRKRSKLRMIGRTYSPVKNLFSSRANNTDRTLDALKRSNVMSALNEISMSRPSSAQSQLSVSSSDDFYMHTQNMDELLAPDKGSQNVDAGPSTKPSNAQGRQEDEEEMDVVDLHVVPSQLSQTAGDEHECVLQVDEMVTVFSLRNPFWAGLLEWRALTLPWKMKEFTDMILDTVELAQFSIPSWARKLSMKVLQVEEMKLEEDVMIIEGNWCLFQEPGAAASQGHSRNRSSSTKGICKISSSTLQKVFLKTVKTNEIIAWLNLGESTSSEQSEQSLYFHLSSKDEPFSSLLMADFPEEVELKVGCALNKDHNKHFHSVVKISLRELRFEVEHGDHEQVQQDLASPTPQTDEDSDDGNLTDVSGGLGEDQIQRQEDEAAIETDSDKILVENPPIEENSMEVEAPPLSIPQNVSFVPGPLRPKLRKLDSGQPYVYHKLLELEKQIKDIAAEALRNNQTEICPMITTPCNVHAIVDKVIPDVRHRDAYKVRVSDETKRSVLLRLHNKIQKNVGPPIEVGDIIRIHRLTVQTEWDQEVEETVMVLSSAIHHDYVLFRSSEDPTAFEFHTCAKTITLTDFDRKRVGELGQLKSSILQQRLSGERSPRSTTLSPVRVLSDPELNLNASLPLHLSHGSSPTPFRSDGDDMQPESDGIYSSDLASPDFSVVNSSSFEEFHENADLLEKTTICAESDEKEKSTSVCSDESYVTARSENEPTSPSKMDFNDIEIARVNRKLMLELGFITPTNSEGDQSSSVPSNQLNSNFTCFKDLRKTPNTVNLLFRVRAYDFYNKLISMSTRNDLNAWDLLIQDFEGSSLPNDFRRKLSTSEGLNLGNNVTVLHVSNVKQFTQPDIAEFLFAHQGLGSLFVAENVIVKGASPPYHLEGDGESCVIRQAASDDLNFLALDESFTSPLTDTSDPKQPSPSSRRGQSVSLNRNEPQNENETTSTPQLSSENAGSTSRRDGESVRSNNDKGSSETDQVSTPQNGNQETPKSSSSGQPWTGERAGRRKPRIFY